MSTPIRCSHQQKTCSKYSIGGDQGTSVPPVSRKVQASSARSASGTSVWSTRETAPAVPMSKAYSPPQIGPGANSTAVLPMRSPSTFPEHTSAAARMAVRWEACRPGFGRPARMRSIRQAFPVSAERATAVRRICPPPSPCDPSTSITSRLQDPTP